MAGAGRGGDATPGAPTTFSDQLGRQYLADPSGRHPFRALVHGTWSEWVCDGPGRPVRADLDGIEPASRRSA